MQRRSQRSVEHSGGRAGRVSLWSGKGSSARVEAGTRLWRGSLEPLPIGIPRLQAGEDVKYREEKDGEIFFKLSAHDLLSSFRDLKDAIGEKNDNGVRAI
jgi:hypothetical protein